MGVFDVIGGVLMIISSLAIMFFVAAQESPKGTGISALTGGDSYFSKNQGRTRDAMLAKLTKVCAIVFFAVTIIVSVLNVWL